jgi:hypothetical protein
MALACLLLAACASAPQADSSKIGDVERAASVGPGGFLMYAPTSFGTANGGRKNVDFIPGVFAQSATRVHILSYDRLAKTFRQDMSFETASIRGVAMVSGPFGRKQLQIKTETGVIACEMGGLHGGKLAAEVYDHLIAAGAHPFESPGWVDTVFVPGPTVITVYVPAPHK